MPHPGWLPNKLIYLELPGRGRVQSRVLGLADKVLILLAPAVEGKTIWPNPGTALTVVLSGPTGEISVSGTIVDRKLKPFPLLYLAVDEDIPFIAAVAARPRKIIAIASGKGGTGKTFFCLNLGWQLATMNRQAILVDLDLGTANLAAVLGLHPNLDLSAVILRNKEFTEILYPISSGLTIIPGAARNKDFADLSTWQLQRLAAGLGSLEPLCDHLILDTSAGLSANTTTFLYCADYVVLVINDTPTSIIDAYGLIKAMASQFWVPPAGIIINRASNQSEAAEYAGRFIHTAKEFLGVTLDYLGAIPEDNSATQSLKATRPMLALYPWAPASESIKTISARLLEKLTSPQPKQILSANANYVQSL